MSFPDIQYIRDACKRSDDVHPNAILQLCDVIDRVVIAANDGVLCGAESDHINRALGLIDRMAS